jgi:hypothetical protein
MEGQRNFPNAPQLSAHFNSAAQEETQQTMQDKSTEQQHETEPYAHITEQELQDKFKLHSYSLDIDTERGLEGHEKLSKQQDAYMQKSAEHAKDMQTRITKYHSLAEQGVHGPGDPKQLTATYTATEWEQAQEIRSEAAQNAEQIYEQHAIEDKEVRHIYEDTAQKTVEQERSQAISK